MALEDILKRIREDAHKEAEKIGKEAETRAEAILEETKKEAVSIREKLLEEGEASSQQERRRILTIANLESRKEILGRKQNLIESAFQKASNHLLHLSDAEYQAIVKKMLLGAVESGQEEVIISSGDEKRITPSFLEEVNKELAEKGRPGKLRLSPERRQFMGGFILRSSRKEIKCTFDSLLKESKDELEGEISRILFSGDKDSG
ncbi:V-type ATP synthase subunit E [candidate division NPL-UPA2 bacterium]|nr:V-type ATP synthase subunit E [candidate division NPL-UPA2 bacterium]